MPFDFRFFLVFGNTDERLKFMFDYPMKLIYIYFRICEQFSQWALKLFSTS